MDVLRHIIKNVSEIVQFGFNRTVWIHDVSDVWMNGWVLKKLSKDVFDGFADDVKGIKQELQHMYVCVPDDPLLPSHVRSL